MSGICGIAGIWRRDGLVLEHELACMLETLKHRGPDGEGSFLERGLGLGMRRLAILDVENGHQPYVSEDGSLVAVFNGELYNYPQLKVDLERRGHHLRSHADGEVLVHLFEEYRADLLDHITGMFALAIWDRRRQELLLARDRIGQKPLYILDMDHTLAFASEIKAFLGIDGYTPAVDERMISSYLAHRFAPAPATLLKHVTKLRPGEALRVRADGHRMSWQYWTPDLSEPESDGTLDQWAERLDARLADVVQSHLASDVPLGLFLSGGVDSSILAALVAKGHAGTIKAWSAAFPEHFPGYDEFEWAKRVADLYQFPIQRVDVHPAITPERVRELAWILDEPMADPTVLPLDGVAEAASRFNTVMLSGEGADEIFGGYAGYGEVASLDWIRRIPATVRQWWIAHDFKGSGAFRRAAQPIGERYRGVGYTFGPDEQGGILVPELKEPDRTEAVREYWDTALGLPDLQAMQGFDVRWFLPDDVLLKADRIGMHHNLEIRVPYCDHEIVELALKIPLVLRRRGRIDKRVLRRVGEKHLPKEVVYRPKLGFPTPLTSLMAGALYDVAYDSLTDSRFRARGWFRAEAVESLLSQLAGHNPVAARKAYALLMLEFWIAELVEDGPRRVARSVASTSAILQTRRPSERRRGGGRL
ncbi:MAG: asparagine synthase (glutamine-hydrolyzing) [Thermaerobacter sp.]|nr:asparagine synthase (glutamine-hydrolyzing) [Thermaerobacter sp.]